MAIDAKMSFLRQLEAKSAEEMTMADIQRMMVIVSDVLEGFDMRERSAWEEEGTDDLLDSFMASMQIQGRSEKTIARYRTLIRFAREAGINYFRFWGGGIFERDLFYDLCDENGIMIWHDFMLSGPADAPPLKLGMARLGSSSQPYDHAVA